MPGQSCELSKNVCSDDPCHGGKCYLKESGFYCDCIEGEYIWYKSDKVVLLPNKLGKPTTFTLCYFD